MIQLFASGIFLASHQLDEIHWVRFIADFLGKGIIQGSVLVGRSFEDAVKGSLDMERMTINDL